MLSSPVAFHSDNNHLPTGVCCSKYSKQQMEKTLRAIKKARNGGLHQAIKRVLNGVPICGQLVSESPYFDLNLYSFDEKVVGGVPRYYLVSYIGFDQVTSLM